MPNHYPPTRFIIFIKLQYICSGLQWEAITQLFHDEIEVIACTCVFICLHPSLFGIALLTDVSWKLLAKAWLRCLIDFGLFIMKASFDLFLQHWKIDTKTVDNFYQFENYSPFLFCSFGSFFKGVCWCTFALTMTDKSSPSVLTMDNFYSFCNMFRVTEFTYTLEARRRHAS